MIAGPFDFDDKYIKCISGGNEQLSIEDTSKTDFTYVI